MGVSRRVGLRVEPGEGGWNLVATERLWINAACGGRLHGGDLAGSYQHVEACRVFM